MNKNKDIKKLENTKKIWLMSKNNIEKIGPMNKKKKKMKDYQKKYQKEYKKK